MPQLTGYVYRPDGTPAENATVALPQLKRFVLADETGWYDFGDIVRGEYTVQVVHRDYPKVRFSYTHTQVSELTIRIEE